LNSRLSYPEWWEDLSRLRDIRDEEWQPAPAQSRGVLGIEAEPPKTAGRRPAIKHWSLRAALALIDEGAAVYDHVGLLKPAQVDLGTGYRRYRESQLATARLVVMLRLDMPLVQVVEIVSAPGPVVAERLASYWEGFEHRIAGQRELVGYIYGWKVATTDSSRRRLDRLKRGDFANPAMRLAKGAE
jgi:DNA-binding transcriptional MerR regulator